MTDDPFSIHRNPRTLNFEYRFSVDHLGAGRIGISDNLSGEVRQRVLDTQDAMVRQKLIELGWTPPKEMK